MSPSQKRKISQSQKRRWRIVKREIAAGKRISWQDKRKPRKVA